MIIFFIHPNISLSQAPPDLSIFKESINDIKVSLYKKFVVSWTAHNNMIDCLQSDGCIEWNDAVFLSKDRSWNTDDILIGSSSYGGLTAPGEGYNLSTECLIPTDTQPGQYYIIVYIDFSEDSSQGKVIETNETNNWVVVNKFELDYQINDLVIKIKDAVLERKQEDVSTFDLNEDGIVDVADVVNAENHSPIVSFIKETSIVDEGVGSIDCKVKLSRPFSGYLQYEVSGTATVGSDYQPTTGNFLVDASSAKISIILVDNLEVEATKTIILTIKPSTLTLGTPNSHIIILEDNDALWQGHLVRDDLRLPLEMTITQKDSQLQAAVISNGSGTLPYGKWAVDIDSTLERFNATIGPIEIQQSNSLLNASLTRKIYLTSEPLTNPEHVLDFGSKIEGSMYEEWKFSEPNTQHLNKIDKNSIKGTFILIKADSGLQKVKSDLFPLLN